MQIRTLKKSKSYSKQGSFRKMKKVMRRLMALIKMRIKMTKEWYLTQSQQMMPVKTTPMASHLIKVRERLVKASQQ